MLEIFPWLSTRLRKKSEVWKGVQDIEKTLPGIGQLWHEGHKIQWFSRVVADFPPQGHLGVTQPGEHHQWALIPYTMN